MGQPAADGCLFRVDRGLGDDGAVLRLGGQLDLSTAHLLDAEISRLDGQLSRALVVDLRELEFIDCAGVRPLVRLSVELTAHRGRLIVSGPTRLVAFVLTAAGLADSISE